MQFFYLFFCFNYNFQWYSPVSNFKSFPKDPVQSNHSSQSAEKLTHSDFLQVAKFRKSILDFNRGFLFPDLLKSSTTTKKTIGKESSSHWQVCLWSAPNSVLIIHPAANRSYRELNCCWTNSAARRKTVKFNCAAVAFSECAKESAFPEWVFECWTLEEKPIVFFLLKP